MKISLISICLISSFSIAAAEFALDFHKTWRSEDFYFNYHGPQSFSVKTNSLLLCTGFLSTIPYRIHNHLSMVEFDPRAQFQPEPSDAFSLGLDFLDHDLVFLLSADHDKRGMLILYRTEFLVFSRLLYYEYHQTESWFAERPHPIEYMNALEFCFPLQGMNHRVGFFQAEEFSFTAEAELRLEHMDLEYRFRSQKGLELSASILLPRKIAREGSVSYEIEFSEIIKQRCILQIEPIALSLSFRDQELDASSFFYNFDSDHELELKLKRYELDIQFQWPDFTFSTELCIGNTKRITASLKNSLGKESAISLRQELTILWEKAEPRFLFELQLSFSLKG
jgi:hypothetical protein